MDRLTWRQLKQLLNFLRAGYACSDSETFITHLLSGIPTLIPAEITSYTEFNPSERQSRLWLIEPTDAATQEDRRIFEAHIHEQPLIASFMQAGDGGAFKNSDFLTQRQFHRTALYNEFYRRVGMEHTMAIHLGAPPLIIGIALHRALTDFSERERLLFDLLRPHLAQAYANIQAITEMRREAPLQRQLLDTNEQGVVVLTKDGQVQWFSPCAHRYLAAYFGRTTGKRLPDALRAWLRHQEAALSRADTVPHPLEPLQVERDGTPLPVRHLCETDHCLLLLEERQRMSELLPYERRGLTRREAEVLQWVARGKTNAEIGCILGLSPRTVQKHLEHVFKKLGVETRLAAATLDPSWRRSEEHTSELQSPLNLVC